MNTKTVKETKGYCKFHSFIGNEVDRENCSDCKELENEMPPTLLDDMISDWEHDNLIENG